MRNIKLLFFFIALSVMICQNSYAAQTARIAELKKTSVNLDADNFRESINGTFQTSQVSQKSVSLEESKTLDDKYVLAPGDSISIDVWGEPDFAQKDVLIRPDGFITIEPFGEVKAAGKTVTAFTQQLKAKFGVYLKAPKVSITISNYRTSKVYVYGAVNRSGLYEPEKNHENCRLTNSENLTVASVIAGSGGIKHNADIKHILVTNNNSGKQREVDLSKLIKEGDASQDILLSSGDTVYVPYIDTSAQISDTEYKTLATSSLMAQTFKVRVIGEVMKPGLYDISSEAPGVSSAISSAEGFTSSANKKVVKIIRKTPNGNEATIFTAVDKAEVLLRPEDIVEVSMRKAAKASAVYEFLTGMFTPFSRLADACNSFAALADPDRYYKYWRY